MVITTITKKTKIKKLLRMGRKGNSRQLLIEISSIEKSMASLQKKKTKNRNTS